MIVNKLELIATESKINISNATISAPNKVYNGDYQSPDITVTYNGQTLIKNIDYSVSSTLMKYARTYSITITGLNNFTGSKNVSWTIEKKPIKIKSLKASPSSINASSYTDVTISASLSPSAYENINISIYMYSSISGNNITTYTSSKSSPSFTTGLKLASASSSGKITVKLNNNNYSLMAGSVTSVYLSPS